MTDSNKISLYHNPRCSKSREALGLLREHGIEPEIILYLDTPPSTTQLKKLLKRLGIGARALLRKTEDDYKTLGLSDEQLTEQDLIAAMQAHPKLIERPIAIKGAKAVIGRPPENVLQLIHH